MRTAAEGHEHFDGLDEAGNTVALPSPSADRAFVFAEVRIAHNSPLRSQLSCLVLSTAILFRGNNVCKEGMKFVSVLARGSVDDDCSISTIAVDFFYPKAVPFQPSSGVVGTQIHVQVVAFDARHGRQFSVF
jgi:hypothetical protein